MPMKKGVDSPHRGPRFINANLSENPETPGWLSGVDYKSIIG
jgi:hypothetical protein